MAVYENSRYVQTNMLMRRGFDIPVLDIRQRFSFTEDLCAVYTWIEGDTLDDVAYKFYNNTHLRWAIMDANPQYSIEFEIQNGDQILIPNYEEVVDIVNV